MKPVQFTEFSITPRLTWTVVYLYIKAIAYGSSLKPKNMLIAGEGGNVVKQ